MLQNNNDYQIYYNQNSKIKKYSCKNLKKKLRSRYTCSSSIILTTNNLGKMENNSLPCNTFA